MSVTTNRQESRRQEEQSRLDTLKSLPERNKIGQYATPPPLAKEIAQYVNCLWQSRSDRIHLLEPALGTGAFFSALRQALPADLIESALGVEIDREFAETADHLWQNTGLVTLNADFTALQPPAAERRANLIVTNPPYVRHHHLGGDEKTRLKLAAEQILGKGVSGLTGLYCYFILLAHQWLADDGIGVWLIPSEFMDVNYGDALKNYLTSKVTLLHIHRFDPLEVQFGDALVSSSVVVYRKTPPATGHTVKFSFSGSLTKPGRERIMPARTLARIKKWSRILNGRATVKASLLLPTQNAKPLSSLFAVKRGLATGANDFFILPKEYAMQLGVSERFLKPILPSPRHLRANIIESGPYGNPLLENPLVLIDSNLPEEDLKESCPALWEYLREGEKQGIRNAYLVGKRNPWYKQEQREPAPFLCTYMGRTASRENPFRFLWNRSRAVATNVYLFLYPIDPLRTALDKSPELAEAVFNILQNIKAADLIDEGRVYGGGLHKLEPKELMRINAARIFDEIGLGYQPILF